MSFTNYLFSFAFIGDHTVGGVFIRTMKITTKDEKSSTEMYAAASNELTVVNKQASTKQTEATKKVGLFGLGGRYVDSLKY